MKLTFADRGIIQIDDARIILETLEEKDLNLIRKVAETLPLLFWNSRLPMC